MTIITTVFVLHNYPRTFSGSARLVVNFINNATCPFNVLFKMNMCLFFNLQLRCGLVD